MVWQRPSAWGLAGLPIAGHQHHPGTGGCKEAVPTGMPFTVPSGPVGSAITCHHTEFNDTTSAPVSVPLHAPGPKLGDTLSPKALQCPDPNPLIHCTKVGDAALQWCNPDLAPSSSSCCPTVLAAQHWDEGCTPPPCPRVPVLLGCQHGALMFPAQCDGSSTSEAQQHNDGMAAGMAWGPCASLTPPPATLPQPSTTQTCVFLLTWLPKFSSLPCS